MRSSSIQHLPVSFFLQTANDNSDGCFCISAVWCVPYCYIHFLAKLAAISNSTLSCSAKCVQQVKQIRVWSTVALLRRSTVALLREDAVIDHRYEYCLRYQSVPALQYLAMLMGPASNKSSWSSVLQYYLIGTNLT